MGFNAYYVDLLRNAGLDDVARRMETEWRRDAIVLETTETDEHGLPIGETKIGGLPDLPPGVEWPCRGQSPLAFIAQINLSETSRLSGGALLPDSGWLYFFYDDVEGPWGFDPADRDGWKVFHHDGDAASLIRTAAPPVDDRGSYQACGVVVKAEGSYPGMYSTEQEILSGQFTEPEEDLHEAVIEAVDSVMEDEGDTRHQLLGYPDIIQGDMRLECQLASHGLYCGDGSGYQDPRAEQLGKGADDWILLLQIDSEDQTGMCWGDVGRLYYMIRKQDLAARDFDKVWLVLQCY